MVLSSVSMPLIPARGAPTGPALPTPWPSIGLDFDETLVADREEQVHEGFLRGTTTEAIVATRDLGPEVSASLWQDEVTRLFDIHHPAAATVIDARIERDRFVMLTTLKPEGEPLRKRLRRGPPTADEAHAILRDALALVEHLHARGLSAAGLWLRTGFLCGAPGGPRFVIGAFGLRIDHQPDPTGDLRELATRLLTTLGARHAPTGLALPPGSLAPLTEAVLRRAIGHDGPAFSSARAAREVLAAMP